VEEDLKTREGKERKLRFSSFGAAGGGSGKIAATGVPVCISGENVCLDPLDPKDVVSSRTKGAKCGWCDGT